VNASHDSGFRFDVLPEGTYDFQAQRDAFDLNGGPDESGVYMTLTRTREHVAVTSPATDIGVIELPPIPPQGG